MSPLYNTRTRLSFVSQNRQAATFTPSKEDSERLQNLKTQFNEICDELYLNLVDSEIFFYQLNEAMKNFSNFKRSS
ncbi:7416_t:CDS:2 [Gigaspora margarita]|uniref:7416_t:CDS:1 n=1 Tax=Gigaspora margarita TaxID=4874 RepID=A0ABN7UH18_GIGMA|nr:7416_t:CDS:2 [Gigaspora margarita]